MQDKSLKVHNVFKALKKVKVFDEMKIVNELSFFIMYISGKMLNSTWRENCCVTSNRVSVGPVCIENRNCG